MAQSALTQWRNAAKESDEAKENARLRKELRDTQDALAILKKTIGILGN